VLYKLTIYLLTYVQYTERNKMTKMHMQQEPHALVYRNQSALSISRTGLVLR